MNPLLSPAAALGSAATLGIADFTGGVAGRRTPPPSVAVGIEICGLAAIPLALFMLPVRWDLRSASLAFTGGVVGGLGLILFYRAMTLNLIGVVAPVSAVVAAALPTVVGVLGGDHLHLSQFGGIAAGLGVAAEVFDWTAIQSIFNWFSAIEGGIFLVLAYLASRKSAVAIGIGAGLYFLDTLALLFSGHFSYLRLFILAVLIRSVLAANMLSKRAKTVAAPDQSRAA
jgi:hypothetical protein